MNSILSGAINLKNISSREYSEQQQAELDALKNQLAVAEAKRKAKIEDEKLKLDQEKAKRDAGKVSRDIVEKNGKRYERIVDASGNVISETEIGAKAPESYKPNVFEGVDGNLIEVPVGAPIPVGAKMPTTRNVELTKEQEFKRGKDLASIEQFLTSGIDSKGKEIDNVERLQGWADVYNESNPDYNMVLVPAKPGKKVLGITIPGTSTPAEYIKVPKDAKQAPTVAVEYLRSHPELKNDFFSKYGYLPEGL